MCAHDTIPAPFANTFTHTHTLDVYPQSLGQFTSTHRRVADEMLDGNPRSSLVCLAADTQHTKTPVVAGVSVVGWADDAAAAACAVFLCGTADVFGLLVCVCSVSVLVYWLVRQCFWQASRAEKQPRNLAHNLHTRTHTQTQPLRLSIHCVFMSMIRARWLRDALLHVLLSDCAGYERVGTTTVYHKMPERPDYFSAEAPHTARSEYNRSGDAMVVLGLCVCAHY